MEEIIDIEAMIEAISSLNGLYEKRDKISEKITDLQKDIAKAQEGKTSLKSFFNFKSSKEELLSKYIAEKTENENNLKLLGQILIIVSYNLENQIQKFKAEKMTTYYDSLKNLADILKSNNENLNELWSTVTEDKNIKKLNI